MDTETKTEVLTPVTEQKAQPPTLRRETIIVESHVAVLDTAKFDHMSRIAKLMASSSLVPEHLNAVRKVGGKEVAIDQNEAVANCFLVVNQAVAWRMDPFAVAQHTFVHKGKIGYEGKLVAAVINTHPELIERLSYKYDGSGESRKVTVSGRMSSDTESKTIEGTLVQWRTSNDNWSKSPDQMLAYRGAREWARRWMPEAILGVWSEDEVEQMTATDRTQGHHQPEPQRGPAALRAALDTGTGTGGVAAASGTAIAQPAAAIESGGTGGPANLFEKTPGSLEQRDALIAKMKGCTDQEVLDLVRDGGNGAEWSKPDLDLINAAYTDCKAALEKTKL